MNEVKGRGTKRCFVAVMTVAVMMAAFILPAVNASAAMNLTPDGLVEPDAEINLSEHNSYAWCGAVFTQEDGIDYLWVGTNRDLAGLVIDSALRTILAGTIEAWRDAGRTETWINNRIAAYYVNPVCDSINIPRPIGGGGEIYRIALGNLGEDWEPEGDWEPQWELMFSDPYINGYRKMLVFNDELYVFTGLTNVVSGVFDYSVVYRFGQDFEQGDEPDIVLWEKIPSGSAEYFRPACIYDNNEEQQLFIGTFDLLLYYTQGDRPGNYELGGDTTEMDEAWGMTNAVEQHIIGMLVTMFGPSIGVLDAAAMVKYFNIWDIVWLDDSLYVFVGSALSASDIPAVAAMGGFLVYKLTPNGSGWDTKQIVGPAAGAMGGNPAGMGTYKHNAASPFVFNVDGIDYVYVTTFANGPMFLGALVGDVMTLMNAKEPEDLLDFSWNSFDMFYAPAVMYRFHLDNEGKEVWETVVGDNDAIGNMRAGFFPGASPINFSSNQYIWWMAEYDDKIWASTWDMGVFRQGIADMVEGVFDTIYPDRAALEGAIEDVQVALLTLIGSIQDLPTLQELMDKITGLIMAAIADIPGKTPSEIRDILRTLVYDLYGVLVDAFGEFVESVQEFIGAITYLFNLIQDTDFVPIMLAMISLIFVATPVFGLFLTDSSNPPGFDLYYSENGVDFYPYTVNGFGDQTNYGGRVLVPSEYGFFILTANPFKGGQVWWLDDVKTEILADIPNEFKMNKGASMSFDIISVGLLPEDYSVTLSDGTVMSLTLSGPEQLDGIPTDYWSIVETSGVMGTRLLGSYTETSFNEVPVYKYTVTVTGLKDFEGTLTMTIEIGGMTLTEEINVNVIYDRVDALIVAAIVIIMAALMAGAIIIVKRP